VAVAADAAAVGIAVENPAAAETEIAIANGSKP
jgi:hypothetical protein